MCQLSSLGSSAQGKLNYFLFLPVQGFASKKINSPQNSGACQPLVANSLQHWHQHTLLKLTPGQEPASCSMAPGTSGSRLVTQDVCLNVHHAQSYSSTARLRRKFEKQGDFGIATFWWSICLDCADCCFKKLTIMISAQTQEQISSMTELVKFSQSEQFPGAISLGVQVHVPRVGHGGKLQVGRGSSGHVSVPAKHLA